jgi:predicted nucleotide-binding protein (sugar kinase/HSP70/actin superfamily)
MGFVMRVGIPRALLYHRYGQFWQHYLSGLGVEVVVSRPTDKEVLEQGLCYVSSEVCLPIKIAAGHLAELRGRVDKVFFPRMVWLEDRLYACPKMIGIVDICRMMMGRETPVVAPVIKGDFLTPHFAAGLAFNRNPATVARALARARSSLPRTPAAATFPPHERRVALIGHFYNLGDDYISRAVSDTFARHGYRICTKDELPQAVLQSRTGFARNIRWVYERELYNAFRFLVDKVDGVCIIVSMGCGPDSLVAEFMRQESVALDRPFLQLVIDEHTGTAGLVTRIEAFIDLARRRGKATPRA